ncbi:MAG: DUF4276 family protein [Thermodesulfobacteriota bacterium]|nr:DUF4276 family protein [Thermodesulfobacteriota bacterium]
MHIEFLVEESSSEAALHNILPRVLQEQITFAIHPFRGKPDLLKKLPARLRGYRAWIPDSWGIVVLADADEDDCREIKAKLEKAAIQAKLVTKSGVSSGSHFQVLNRLAIEELEAWFFGDIGALHSAYPRISLRLGDKARYRDPDAIVGGTWEALERELKRVGYFPGGLNKISAAREISKFMAPERNRSRSFQIFRQGLIEMIQR